MAKKAKKTDIDKLEVINPMSAGIDVGATLMQVCIPSNLDKEPNRAFGTTTRELDRIVEWLVSKKITHVAMESTGVYWVPLFNKLTEAGIDTKLLRAADVKNYTARKTDVNDARWLMVIMRHEMVKPSYQISPETRMLRDLSRFRSNIVSNSARTVLRIQQHLELMNLKLTEVLDDIMGVSGRSIIEAMIGGCRDPRALAELMDPRCRKSKDEMAEALECTWEDHGMFILDCLYKDYLSQQATIEKTDIRIRECLDVIKERVLKQNEGISNEVVRASKKVRVSKNGIRNCDMEEYSTHMLGVNIVAIDGLSGLSAYQLIAELGRDFTRHFETPARFCSWCGLVPNDRITGGRKVSSAMKTQTNKVGLILKNCAQTLARQDSRLGSYYRRMKTKGGGKFAVIATAHKMARILYAMVKDQTEYNPETISVSDEKFLDIRIKAAQKRLDQLLKEKNKIA